MTNSEKALDVLINKISSLIDTKLSQKKDVVIFKSTIWGKNSDGSYTISYKNQKYNVPNGLGTDLSLGQSVWVTIPMGIIRHMYISAICKTK